MTFREAKQTIREALREASDAKLVESLEAARAGEIPYKSTCMCLAGRLHGEDVMHRNHLAWWRLSDAYGYIACPDDAKRQRILVPMVLAEIRRRSRPHDNAEALEALKRAVGTNSEVLTTSAKAYR